MIDSHEKRLRVKFGGKTQLYEWFYPFQRVDDQTRIERPTTARKQNGCVLIYEDRQQTFETFVGCLGAPFIVFGMRIDKEKYN